MGSLRMLTCGIIGSSGYLGKQLVKYVCDNEYNIRFIHFDRAEQSFRGYNLNQRRLDILLNLGVPNEMISRINAKAANNAVQDWWVSFKNAILIGRPHRCLHISTYHIYGASNLNINENSKFQTGNPYGDVHIECIKLARNICKSDKIHFTTLVVTNIFGTIHHSLAPRDDLILNNAIIRLHKGEKIELNSNGQGKRDFIWIGDFLKAVVCLIQKRSILNDTLLLSSSITITVSFALMALFDALGNGHFSEWCSYGSIKQDGPYFTVNNNKLKSILNGWFPKSVAQAAKQQREIFYER